MNPTDQVFHLDHHFKIQERRSRRARLVVFSVVGLFVAGAVGTCVASSFDDPVQPGPSYKPPLSSEMDDRVLKNFRLRGDDKVEALNKQKAALQSEIKRLSDQVSAMTSRMESLEASIDIRKLQSSTMASMSPAKRSESPAPAAKSAVAKPPSKRASPTKMVGPSSVGGAPLTLVSRISQ